jgi:hypothetical protein
MAAIALTKIAPRFQIQDRRGGLRAGLDAIAAAIRERIAALL